ncbi:MAG TPA: chemotaxis response regulator protein-glutamate methylesterase [Candidatus Agathobaculum pullicola]|uniref:protein-glutamate methylesterase/protein-glutamine glutaminase n=1 Tax=Candidatus Agathobaculum pullicola TaxID=2838426 RepID=UPI001F88F8A8|nr:chemotaxis response regulator protein-glutamate methylesterase [Candidatus Agathobaculum pullicola]
MGFDTKKIRVMIVDDSMLARRIIQNGLAKYPNIEVVGEAFNAMDARKKLPTLNPDVMTLDVEMPGMNGIDFVKDILPIHPIPIILVSSLNLRVFDAMAVGAVDFVRKPDGAEGNDRFIEALANKIVVASCARVRRPPLRPAVSTNRITSLPLKMGAAPTDVIIGLGASTGGTEATLEVLRRLPANIPGMVIVQHMPPGFTQMYAERLDRICRMKVKEAEHGDEIVRGRVLIAPGDKQMRVVRSGNRYTVSCLPGEKVSGHCPSVDALFLSMAQNVQCHMVGIIMTGMGSDGAKGLLEMRKQGAYTIGQDKDSCVVYGMPMVAHNIGAVMQQASCENIAGLLVRHLSNSHL